ncbi:MAG: flavodoxin family protein [Oscillospiraceae bacterium]|nr:flavodoxin family protein [Oscillospiraceae bacterium]
MKTVIVNGGPRKEWNTAQLLKSAQKGAEVAGAETEYVDLRSALYRLPQLPCLQEERA